MEPPTCAAGGLDFLIFVMEKFSFEELEAKKYAELLTIYKFYCPKARRLKTEKLIQAILECQDNEPAEDDELGRLAVEAGRVAAALGQDDTDNEDSSVNSHDSSYKTAVDSSLIDLEAFGSKLDAEMFSCNETVSYVLSYI